MQLAVASLLAILVVTLSAAPVGQPPAVTMPKPQIETKHLTIEMSWRAQAAAPVGRISLLVDVTPKPTMHVYAPDEKEAIPVSLTLTENDGFKPSTPKFPKAEKYYFAPLKLTQLVYAKPFRIDQPLTLVRDRVAGSTLEIKGTLRYQACDDKVCYLPQNVPLSWELPIR